MLCQVRHADVSPDAMVVFLGLAGALMLEIISIYHSSRTFWIVFCFVSANLILLFIIFCFQYYILVNIVATIHAYNQGRLKEKVGLSWYSYYWEVATIFYEESKKLLTGVIKERFILAESAKKSRQHINFFFLSTDLTSSVKPGFRFIAQRSIFLFY